MRLRLPFAHGFQDVIADNCLSLPELEVASFDVCFNANLFRSDEEPWQDRDGVYLIGTAGDKGVEKSDGEERRRGLVERQIGFCDAQRQ